MKESTSSQRTILVPNLLREFATHDYKRHGTTTLFAALNVHDGTVIGRNMQRHRHQDFVRFLNTIEEQVPVGM